MRMHVAAFFSQKQGIVFYNVDFAGGDILLRLFICCPEVLFYAGAEAF